MGKLRILKEKDLRNGQLKKVGKGKSE